MKCFTFEVWQYEDETGALYKKAFPEGWVSAFASLYSAMKAFVQGLESIHQIRQYCLPEAFAKDHRFEEDQHAQQSPKLLIQDYN